MSLTEKLLLVLSILIVLLVVFHPHKAKAFEVHIGVPVPVVSDYQNCIDTCLAYNGYDTNTYNFCQNECYYQPPVVIVGGSWFHGAWYPRGHFERGHDYDRGHDRHDGDRHGRR